MCAPRFVHLPPANVVNVDQCRAYERFGSDATGCGQCAGSTTTYGWPPPWSTQAVVFVLPVCTVPSLHVALVVSGVSLPLTVFAAFFVPVAVSFAASSVT